VKSTNVILAVHGPDIEESIELGFIRRYHSEKMKGEYRIDVVSESGFHQLVRDIDKEMNEIAKRIRRHQIVLRRSANRIAKEKLRERKK
jgi:hypothetical protein